MAGNTPMVVGLTGGIASGKSTVAANFRALGVPVCDADQVARAVVEPGTPGITAVQEHFPSVVNAEQQLDRRKLRDIVFNAPEQRRLLESLLHPLIYQGLLDFVQQQTAPYLILEVALLNEGPFQQLCDRVLVVDVPVTLQQQRVMARDNCDLAAANRIIATQHSREERLALADDVIINDQKVAILKTEIAQRHQQYLQLAARQAQ